MNDYSNYRTPDNWVIIQVKGPDPHYKVLAGWSGGYLEGTSWRWNSGITKVEETDTHFLFHGYSGSCYKCHKQSYGLRMNNAYIWNQLKEKFGELVEIVDENTNWSEIDWIIKEK